MFKVYDSMVDINISFLIKMDLILSSEQSFKEAAFEIYNCMAFNAHAYVSQCFVRKKNSPFLVKMLMHEQLIH